MLHAAPSAFSPRWSSSSSHSYYYNCSPPHLVPRAQRSGVAFTRQRPNGSLGLSGSDGHITTIGLSPGNMPPPSTQASVDRSAKSFPGCLQPCGTQRRWEGFEMSPRSGEHAHSHSHGIRWASGPAESRQRNHLHTTKRSALFHCRNAKADRKPCLKSCEPKSAPRVESSCQQKGGGLRE